MASLASLCLCLGHANVNTLISETLLCSRYAPFFHGKCHIVWSKLGENINEIFVDLNKSEMIVKWFWTISVYFALAKTLTTTSMWSPGRQIAKNNEEQLNTFLWSSVPFRTDSQLFCCVYLYIFNNNSFLTNTNVLPLSLLSKSVTYCCSQSKTAILNWKHTMTTKIYQKVMTFWIISFGPQPCFWQLKNALLPITASINQTFSIYYIPP